MSRYFNVNKVYFNGFTNDSVKNIVNSVNCNNVYFINNTASNIFNSAPNLTSVTNLNQNTIDIAGAFQQCYNLTTTPTIPNTVINISNTFSYCYNITNITFEEDSSVINMANAFYNCANLQEAIIPNNVTDLYGAFRSCNTITYAPTIPDSVVNMADAFHYCVNLTSANNISNNADNLYLTFSGTGLTDMPIIPNSVTNMYSTFHKCYNLVNVTEIPESVEVMNYTFSQCNNLTGDISIKSEEVKSAGYCFNGTDLEKDVYIPYNYTEDSKVRYKLNARIYGDLVQDGCKFSNFSKNNYLKTILNKIQSPTKLEIAVCVNISDFNTIQNIFMSTTGIKTSIQQSTGKIGQYSSSGWVWSTNILDLNRDVWIKDVFENGECKVYHIYGNYTIETLPTNIESWTLDLTATRGIATTSFVNLGYDPDNTSIDEYLHGTLYLDKAYIKADNILVWKGTTPVAANSIEGTEIIGTLTNNDNVYSGFTENNYLKPDFIIPRTTNNWEIIIKAQNDSTQATDNRGQQILVVGKDITTSEASARILLLTNTAGNVNYSKVFTLDETQTAEASWTWTANAELWYKFKSDRNSTYIYSSSDGITWTLKSSINTTPTTLEKGCEIYLGRCPTAAKGPWKGTIDLNECYMILDDKVMWNGIKKSYPKTKINGTVIGSLNNSNGTISGFTTSNYIQGNYLLDASQDFEIGCKCSVDYIPSNYAPVYGYVAGGNRIFLGRNNNGYAHFNLGDGNGTWGNGPHETNLYMQEGHSYYLKGIKSGNTLTVYISEDNETWYSASTTNSYSSTFYFNLGLEYNNSTPWCGKIYLDDCYLKINNAIVWEGASYATTTTYNTFKQVYPITIKGDIYGTELINNDGIVSGFTTSNAVMLPWYTNTTNTIMYAKFTTTTSGSGKMILFSGYNYTLYFYYSSLTLTWWSGLSYTYNTITTLNPNTTYWIKMVHNGSTHTLYLSSDGKTYSQLYQMTSQYSGTGNQTYQIGGEAWSGSTTNNPFNGYIDLNEFYITDFNDSVIYKGTYNAFKDDYRDTILSGTIVGSLTNNNGILSNFSTNNYLRLLTAFNPSTSIWEVGMKFTTNNDNPQIAQQLFQSNINQTVASSNRYGICLGIRPQNDQQGNSGKFDFFCSSTTNSWLFDIWGTHTILPNTTYWVKFGWTGTTYYLDYSLDGETYTRDISEQSTTPVYSSLVNTLIGIYLTVSLQHPFLGTIDMMNCYIKINNTIWWKGAAYTNNGVLFHDINAIPEIDVSEYEYELNGTESVTLTRYIGDGGAVTIPGI